MMYTCISLIVHPPFEIPGSAPAPHKYIEVYIRRYNKYMRINITYTHIYTYAVTFHPYFEWEESSAGPTITCSNY